MTAFRKRGPSLGIEVCGERSRPLAVREFVSSERYKSLGRQYRLKVSTTSDGGLVRLAPAFLSLILKKGLPERLRGLQARFALVGWYRAKAKRYLPLGAASWASKLTSWVSTSLAFPSRNQKSGGAARARTAASGSTGG
jgi:hypothetical protein